MKDDPSLIWLSLHPQTMAESSQIPWLQHTPPYIIMEEEGERQKEDRMQEEANEDLFHQFLGDSLKDRSLEIEKVEKPIHYRSTKNLVRRSDFRKILNSSSSNERLIPSSIKYDSSREHSERMQMELQGSVDSQSFRRSFKKKFEESFVSNIVRNSSSSFSERSDSKSSHNIIIPQVYKEEKEEMVEEERKGCNCKRSRCLKLYCECFQKQLFCAPHCHCQGCGNNRFNAEEHKQAVIEALARNAHGFEDEPESQADQEGFSLVVEPQAVKKGCKCKKTKCLKKYCECYHTGTFCSIFCRCEGCSNKQLLDPPPPI